jgi:tetratricopeptide (TPR) repeat protein
VLLEQALTALGHLPQTRLTTELAIDVRLDLPSALIPLGELSRMHGALMEAEGLAEALDDRPRLGRIYSHLVFCLSMLGRPSQAVEMGRRALVLASELGDLATEIVASYRMGSAYLTLGEMEQAIEIFTRLFDRLQGDLATARFGQPTVPSAQARAILASNLAERGDFETATALAAEAIRFAATAGHAFSLAWAQLGVGRVHLIKGDAAEALQWLERSAELNRDTTSPYLACELDVARGHAFALARRAEEGVPMVERAVERLQAMEYMTPLARALVTHDEVCLRAGRLTEALEISRHAIEVSRHNAQRSVEAMALHALADVLAVQASPDSPADAAYLKALEAATRLGLRPLVAHCHLGLGRLYRRTGTREQAQEHLTTATTMYREMGMTYWLEKAEAELGQLA